MSLPMSSSSLTAAVWPFIAANINGEIPILLPVLAQITSDQTLSLQTIQRKTLLADCRLYGYGICFANVAFLELILSTPLNTSLRNCNTRRVSVSDRKKLGPETYLFSMTSKPNGNFEGQYLWQGTRSGNSVGNYERSPTSIQIHKSKMSWTLVH